MVNYVGHFISNPSQLTQHLRMLLREDSVWDWSVDCTITFNKLKQMLVDSEALAYFDPDKHSTLQVDASLQVIGTCLLKNG